MSNLSGRISGSSTVRAYTMSPTKGTGIASMVQTVISHESEGVNTWTATLTDGSTYSFDVTNGEQGATGPTGPQGATGVGITSVAKTGTSGNVDTYTITFSDGSSTTFTVTNAGDAGTVAYDGSASYPAGSVGNEVTNLKTALAHAYDATKLYHAGEIIYHNGVLYVCLENFEEAEPFTAAHWSQIYVGDELRQIHTAVHALEMLEKSRSFTPAQLEEICKDGVASDYFEIGDIIYIPWTDEAQTTPITYSVPHVVVHFGDIEDENGDIHENGLWLMWMYATPNAVQFDHPEAIIATEETFQSGYYYYTKNGNDYVAQPDVVVGDPIPTGETYYHHVRPSMTGRLRYGSNDWTQSAYRQYLNSAAGKGEWWTAQHESDVAPDQANTLPGFMSGYAQDWLDIFKPIKVTTALNTVCDGGVDAVTYDTFFLPSLEQMYGAPQKSGVEGDVWEYWIQETGYPSRTNGSSSNTNDARKIPSITAPSGAAVSCRLRSAYRSSTNLVWHVNTAGYLYGYNSASTAYRAQPACVIY